MRAAQYVRMSTEHQHYSIENQSAAIAVYARAHDFEVVKTYSDPAKSGIDLAHRPGLQLLLHDVVSGHTEYQAILVYDVSRWGRFQDSDESAFYEFWCKRAGVRVHYCAEPFSGHDESITATLLKAMKRAMAGEYLRELSAKTFAGQCRVAMHGYKLGGVPGYGLRRLLIASDGTPKGIMAQGERKGFASDRVIYVPGPAEEVEIIRQIYSWYLDEHISPAEIARELNELGVSRSPYGKWDHSTVYKILTHPKYTGSVVFNQSSQKFRSRKPKRNSRDQWIVTPDCFEPLISKERFAEAQRRITRPSRRSNQDLLDDLRQAVTSDGKFSASAIQATAGIPSPNSYIKRFGSLVNAYEALGYQVPPGRRTGPVRRQRFRDLKQEVIRKLVARCDAVGQRAKEIDHGLHLKKFGKMRVEVGQCIKLPSGLRWDLRRACLTPGRPVIFIRLTPENDRVLDLVFMKEPPTQKKLARLSEESLRKYLIKDSAEALFEYLVERVASKR